MGPLWGRSMGEPSGDSAIRFGVFEVDLRSGELRKAGIRIKLQDQPFKVLAVLLERPGGVITREELKQRLRSSGLLWVTRRKRRGSSRLFTAEATAFSLRCQVWKGTWRRSRALAPAEARNGHMS